MAAQGDPLEQATPPKATPPQKLPLGISLGFGVGTVGVSCLLNPITTLFPAMMSTVLGLPPAIAGALVTGAKIYDVGADVMIGAVSDRTYSKGLVFRVSTKRNPRGQRPRLQLAAQRAPCGERRCQPGRGQIRLFPEPARVGRRGRARSRP